MLPDGLLQQLQKQGKTSRLYLTSTPHELKCSWHQYTSNYNKINTFKYLEGHPIILGFHRYKDH